jgi:hypothetical protein
VIGDAEESVGRIIDPIDPVSAAGQGHVAVAVDHARDDRRAGGVDDLDARAEVALVAGLPDPRDPAIVDQDAHPQAKALRAGVGESGIPVEDSSHDGASSADIDDPVAHGSTRRPHLDLVADARPDEGRPDR